MLERTSANAREHHSAEQLVANAEQLVYMSAEQPNVIQCLVLDGLTPFSVPI